ncbi:hypothetical protein F5Y18DRAFT_369385 [Xylariaceae sp. FL1019]|nr:hypothetical protein F5Y18DRAFT_369385 [Xylariaceae sp. FL1019]
MQLHALTQILTVFHRPHTPSVNLNTDHGSCYCAGLCCTVRRGTAHGLCEDIPGEACVKQLQVRRGGPLMMVQVDNEYGRFGEAVNITFLPCKIS